MQAVSQAPFIIEITSPKAKYGHYAAASVANQQVFGWY